MVPCSEGELPSQCPYMQCRSGVHSSLCRIYMSCLFGHWLWFIAHVLLCVWVPSCVGSPPSGSFQSFFRLSEPAYLAHSTDSLGAIFCYFRSLHQLALHLFRITHILCKSLTHRSYRHMHCPSEMWRLPRSRLRELGSL